jgi:putative long chain acyl-CoA synthase
VCFGVPDPDGDHALAVGAVTLRKGQKLTIADLEDALGALPQEARPHFVRVVSEIPVTTWYRPITAPLKALGVPDGKKGIAYRLNPEGGYNKVAKPKPKTKEKASA